MSLTEAYLYGGDGIKLRVARVVLTDAQIKALPTTAITLIAAPGAGLTSVPIAYYLVMKAAASYTNINANVFLWARYAGILSEASGYLGNDSGIAAVTQFTDFFAFGAGEKRYPLPPTYFDDRGAANGWGLIGDFFGNAVENAAIELAVDNGGSGNLTGGNVANTLSVHVIHALLNTS